MGGEKSENIYQVLMDRCESLEEKQAKLREHVDELVQEKKAMDHEMVTSDSSMGLVSGFFSSGSPYKSVLQCMGHVVHVYIASFREIIYWNHSAETLYGWKDYEVIGKRVAELLITEEYYAPLKRILERLINGGSWAGQFPFKKRSSEVFMALMTKSLLYEDGELAGVITVSSDAAVFNSTGSENLRTNQSGANGQLGLQRLNFNKVQWHPRPPIASMPQIASSVSNLASKFLLRRHADDTDNACGFSRDSSTDTGDDKLKKHNISFQGAKPNSRYHPGEGGDESSTEFVRPSKIAARVLSKLQIRGSGNNGKDKNNSTTDNSASNEVKDDKE